ncbi:MAG: hypothetical protein DRI89_04605 [Bacteroidetes bacterium]|nr:MAG: hypothetical protein DRI89_04605 [Bacteroidota bacterium]
MKKITLIIFMLAVFVNTGLMAQVAINTTGTAADNSAMLDISSDSMGILIPRMTMAQRDAITSPATGLMIYQVDETTGYYYYDGSSWNLVGSGAFSINDLSDGRTGGNSVFLGAGAGTHDDITDNQNVGIGINSLYTNTSGNANTAIGRGSLYSNSTGNSNTAIGFRSGFLNNTGVDNIFIGDSAGYNNLGGDYNTMVGSWSGWLNTEGTRNAFFGVVSGEHNTTGSRNSYFGAFSGLENDTGSYNCFFGHTSGYYNQGSSNVFIGKSAGFYNKGDSSVCLGFQAGANDTTSNKLYIANSETAEPLVYGEFDKKIIRFNANRIGIRNLGHNTFVGDGTGVMNSGIRNMFLGYYAGYNNTTAKDNIFIGDSTGYYNTTGEFNIFMGNWTGQLNTTGSYNVIIGLGAGMYNVDGSKNVMVGATSAFKNTSGFENIFLGTSAGASNTTGSCNTYLGRMSGRDNQSGDSSIFIGYYAGAKETTSHKLYIANDSTTTPLIYGEFDNALLRVNGTLDISNAFQFPTVDGTNGQVFQTNGSGTLSWATATGDFSNGGEAGGADRTLGNTDNYALSFKTNNTSRMKINNDGGIRFDGNIGIFTDPSDASSVNRSIQLLASGIYSNSYLKLSGHNRGTIYLESRRVGSSPETSGKTWTLASGSGSVADLDKFTIYNQDDGYCFTIRDGGNIGIQEGAPGSRLVVKAAGSTSSTSALNIKDVSDNSLLYVRDDGNAGISTSSPTAKLDINSTTGYDQLRMRTSFTPANSADTNGNTGDIAWDESYMYIKTVAGWKRASLVTF